MIRRSFIGLVIVIAWVAFVLAGCASRRERGDTIKVGSILGLTGDNAAYGEKMKKGFEFALAETNGAGGVGGRKVELVTEDSQFDPQKAVTAYRKLTGAQGIRIIVGITGSANALPVCEASKKEDVVIIDALGSAPKLTSHGGPNYFRIMASDAAAGKYNADWAMESGMKQPAIVYMEDEWGTSYRDALSQNLIKKGFEKVPAYGVAAKTRDFRTEVEKIKRNEPDVIFLLLYAKEGAAFMQQLRQADVKASVYGSDNISSPEFVTAGNEVVEGVRVAMPAHAKGPAYESFVARFKEKTGEEPEANVIKSYDAMKLTTAAIQKVGEEPAKIRKYLKSPEFEYKGVSGSIKFDANGDIIGQEYTRMVYNLGKLSPIK